ncbi:MAG: peptide ABC transporter substrate-binding protein [Chloroflexota bacterium]
MPLKRILSLVIGLLLLAACQPAVEPGLGPVSEYEPIEPVNREPLPEWTPVPQTIEESAVEIQIPESPVLEAVPTLGPTLVPIGVYFYESSGLNLPHPLIWEVDDSEPGRTTFIDSEMEIFVSTSTQYAGDAPTYEELLEILYVDGEVEADRDLTAVLDGLIIQEEEWSFGEEYRAQAALGEVENEGISGWVIYAEYGPRVFIMTAWGDLDRLQARSATLETMLNQATFGQASLYGLSRDETLVRLGGMPRNESLDPALTEGGVSGYIGLLYRGLVRLTPELQVVPDLAETWSVSSDGTVYTFTLRENLTFADGTPITASSVVESWERATDPKVESSTAATYLGEIVGVAERVAGEAESISGLNVIDDRTLEVTLDGSKPYFLAKLTYPTSFIVDITSVDEEDDEWVYAPNPSGPYTFRDVREGEVIIFERNEAYHSPPAIPFLTYLIGGGGSSISLFESGEIDIAFLGGEFAKEVRRTDNPLNANWQSTTSMCTSYVALNNTLPPFDDVNVRLAFALAVDKERQNEIGSDGLDIVAETVLPPAMAGHSQTLVDRLLAERTFDTDAAVAALEASSYGADLPEIVLFDRGSGLGDNDYLNSLISTWEETLGVTIAVENIDFFQSNQVIRELDGHIMAGGWCADYPDPENFLDILFHSESEFNAIRYANSEFDGLLEAARVELDPSQRLALYQQAETLLLDDVGVIPLNFGQSDVLVSPRVKGYTLPVMSGVQMADVLSLDPLDAEEAGE